jgi:hypothetical protein
MTQTAREICQSCRFWHLKPAPGLSEVATLDRWDNGALVAYPLGACRRYPEHSYQYPDHGCGEFVRADDTADRIENLNQRQAFHRLACERVEPHRQALSAALNETPAKPATPARPWWHRIIQRGKP